MAAIALYSDAFWISPWVFSCFVGLREKALPFEVAEVALHKKEQLQGGYAGSTLTGRVPALRHGDFWLAESSAILEYLEEAFPPPGHPRLLPEGLTDRARARQLLSWMRSDETLPIRHERSSETLFYPGSPVRPLSANAQGAAAKLYEVAGRFLPRDDASVFGSWSIVDAELAFLLHRLIAGGDAVPEPLRRYAGAQWLRPSVAQYVAHARVPFVRYF
jgi:glutathione S-transferase